MPDQRETLRVTLACVLAVDRGASSGYEKADFEAAVPNSLLGCAWHDAGIVVEALSAAASAAPKWHSGLCATDGCEEVAVNYFERGGVGSSYCRKCFAKIQELLLSSARAGWRTDMDQAPRDGTRVLLDVPGHLVMIGAWLSGHGAWLQPRWWSNGVPILVDPIGWLPVPEQQPVVPVRRGAAG